MQIPQNPTNIADIPAVQSDYYENIFNAYQTEDDNSYTFYNISNKVSIDVTDISDDYVSYIYIDAPMPLTTISYRIFGSIHLWWLLVIMNKLNPIAIPPANTVFMVPKPQYLQDILTLIKKQ